jgi:peroxiredoxin
MNLLLRTLLLLAVMVSNTPMVSAASPKAGTTAPDFSVRTLDGRTLNLASLRGKVILLHFWATWCPPCREEFPVLQQFYQQHQQDGLEIIAVSIENADDIDKVRAFANAYTFPLALINTADVGGYGRIWRLPLSFVIDRDGVLRKADWSGDEPINAHSLENRVLPWLKPASQAEIQPH